MLLFGLVGCILYFVVCGVVCYVFERVFWMCMCVCVVCVLCVGVGMCWCVCVVVVFFFFLGVGGCLCVGLFRGLGVVYRRCVFLCVCVLWALS